MTQESFLPLVASTWNRSFPQQDNVMLLTAKFKALRCSLKTWQSQVSNLKATISNVKTVISLLEAIEEWNFRQILDQKLTTLLHQQKLYRRQRQTIRWVKLGDENSRFFHVNATIKHRRNLITTLKTHWSHYQEYPLL